MKIESDQLLTTVNRFKNETVEHAGISLENTKNAVSQSGDRVDLSLRREEIDKLKTIMAQTSDNRSAKIAELRQQIADGSYKVDSKEVAGKMLERWRDLNVK